MKPKIWYIFKGSSNFCSELVLGNDCKTMVKDKPEGFYDIVSKNDTIEGATPMVELSAYQALQQENEGLKASIKILEQGYYKDHAEMFKNELEKLEARHKKLLEVLNNQIKRGYPTGGEWSTIESEVKKAERGEW